MTSLSQVLRKAAHGEPETPALTDETGEYVNADGGAASPPPEPTANDRWRHVFETSLGKD